MSVVLSELKDGILTLTINRPEARNALSPEVIETLLAQLKEAEGNSEVRLIALTGAGEKVFCAGGDLKSSAKSGAEALTKRHGSYRETLLALHHCSKPTVALARGHVLAGGMGLLMACDMALVCDDIHFSTPEISVGMFPMMVLAFLSRHVGPKRAAELAFLGERISASSALNWGIVNRVFSRAEFENESAVMLKKLASKSGKILSLGKQAMTQVGALSLEDALVHLEKALGQVMATEDSKEGLRAFAEKREPVWKDK